MNTNLDTSKIATLTGKAIQDDETFKLEGGFVPERDQFYFEMKQGDNVFLVGFKDLLILWSKCRKFQKSVANGGHRLLLFTDGIFKC